MVGIVKCTVVVFLVIGIPPVLICICEHSQTTDSFLNCVKLLYDLCNTINGCILAKVKMKEKVDCVLHVKSFAGMSTSDMNWIPHILVAAN